MDHPMNESSHENELPPLPHLSGKSITAAPGASGVAKRRHWGGMVLNGVALLVGSVFLLWVYGLIAGRITEKGPPGVLSTGDIIGMTLFALLGVGSIGWLVRGFVQRQENRGE